MIYVWDIDGVLADNRHREHFILKGDRESFYDPAQVIKDEPIHCTIELLIALDEAGYENYLLSARRSNLEEVTIEWLKCYEIPYSKLIVRDVGDPRGHAIWKADILRKLDEEEDLIAFYDNEKENCQLAMGVLGLNRVIQYKLV